MKNYAVINQTELNKRTIHQVIDKQIPDNFHILLQYHPMIIMVTDLLIQPNDDKIPVCGQLLDASRHQMAQECLHPDIINTSIHKRYITTTTTR